MGLREWLLKPYLEELKVLREEVKSIKEDNLKVRDELQDMLKEKELLKIQRALEDKADKKIIERELESLSKLVMIVYDKLKELEAYSEVSLGESLLTPQFFMGFKLPRW